MLNSRTHLNAKDLCYSEQEKRCIFFFGYLSLYISHTLLTTVGTDTVLYISQRKWEIRKAKDSMAPPRKQFSIVNYTARNTELSTKNPFRVQRMPLHSPHFVTCPEREVTGDLALLDIRSSGVNEIFIKNDNMRN